MSDLTQGIERGVADFAGSDDNNNNNSNQRQGDESMARPDGNNDESGLRNEERALTGQSSGFGFGAGAGAGAGGGGMEGTADKYVNKVVDTAASEEGVPGMADGMINKDVDAEVNKVI